MSELIDDLLSGSAAAGLVPEGTRHLKRYAFLFVADISGSTGLGGADADIHAINAMMNVILGILRDPPAGDLRDNIDQVDVAVISYNHNIRLDLDWTLAANITTAVRWEADGGTATGTAIKFGLDLIGRRIKYYKANDIPSGMPHIIHVTDGEPSDMTLGTALWNDVCARLARLDGTHKSERAMAKILHFVAPNGCCTHPQSAHHDETGRLLSGQEVLAHLTGPKSVYELSKGAESMAELVKMVTAIITSVTQTFGTAEDTAQKFAQSSALIAPTSSAAVDTSVAMPVGGTEKPMANPAAQATPRVAL